MSLIATALRQYAPRANGAVVTFGVQQVRATRGEALELLRRSGFEPAPVEVPDKLHQDDLFRLFGYRSIESIDYFPNERPTCVHDLNVPVPASLWERFDTVYDGGTAEHCFAAGEVLSNAARLAKPGGLVMHHVPLNNWVDHGFYQFSPTLFFDFYEANGFHGLHMWLHFMMGKRPRESYVPYDPRTDGRLPYCFGGNAAVLLFFSARKAGRSDEIIIPIQGRYRRAFGTPAAAAARLGPLERLRRSLRKRTFRLRARRIA